MQSVKNEVLSQAALFGKRLLRLALFEYIVHYHEERPYQGKGNGILFPSTEPSATSEAPIESRERPGGLLKYNHCKAA